MVTIRTKPRRFPPKFRGQVIPFPNGGEFMQVPCGKCGFCLQNKRSAWMFRIHHEMRNQMYPGYFLTFTYDERHVKRVTYTDPVSGLGIRRLSLRFYDVQLYLKRLRKAKYYAKYICVGEYGSSTNRPHYHMLLWTDAPVEFIQSNWKSSVDDSLLGTVHFGELTMASAMYTLKYIIQPRQVDHTPYGGVEKTRAQFSKGLGIGFLSYRMYDHLTRNYDAPVMFSVIDGQRVAIPRYYRNKIFTKSQLAKERSKAIWDSIRERRKRMRELLKQGITNTKVYMQALRVENSRRIISKTKYNLTI